MDNPVTGVAHARILRIGPLHRKEMSGMQMDAIIECSTKVRTCESESWNSPCLAAMPCISGCLRRSRALPVPVALDDFIRRSRDLEYLIQTLGDLPPSESLKSCDCTPTTGTPT
jgi:hypothetical protein